MEGSQERVYSEAEASPTVSIPSDDDTDSTQSDGKYDSERDPDVEMDMEDDVDAPDSVDLNGDVDMERDGDDEDEEDEQEEDEHEEEDTAKEEDKDEDDGKEPRTIGQGEMVNTSADDLDTTVENQPIVLPEQGQEMRKQTPRPDAPVPAPRPPTPEPCPRPQTPENYPHTGLEDLGLVMLHKRRPAVASLRGAEAAGDTSDVDVD